MGFSDPQVITINSVATDFNRISVEGSRTVFSTAARDRNFTISHQSNKGRQRHMIRIDAIKIATDPISADNVSKTLSVYIVVDNPDFGFTENEIVAELTQLLGHVNYNSCAVGRKVVQGQL